MQMSLIVELQFLSAYQNTLGSDKFRHRDNIHTPLPIREGVVVDVLTGADNVPDDEGFLVEGVERTVESYQVGAVTFPIKGVVEKGFSRMDVSPSKAMAFLMLWYVRAGQDRRVRATGSCRSGNGAAFEEEGPSPAAQAPRAGAAPASLPRPRFGKGRFLRWFARRRWRCRWPRRC